MTFLVTLLLFPVACLTAGTFEEALNNGVTWTTGGDAPWFVESAVSHDGVAAAQSGLLTNPYQSSWLETTITGRVAVLFRWKAADEPDRYCLRFEVNDTAKAWLLGETDWELNVVYLDSETNRLRWTYWTPDSGPANWGLNAAWLDEVELTNVTGLAPTVLDQPQSVSAPDTYPTNARLNAVVLGDPPLSYQWQCNGTNIGSNGRFWGAESSRLLIWNIGANETGDYRLVVSNAWGIVTSAVAVVSVVPSKPYIDPSQLADIEIARGANYELFAPAWGTAPLAYQWEKDGLLLLGKTNFYYDWQNITFPDAGGYRLYVTNNYGTFTSRVVQVTVSTNKPVILSGPEPDAPPFPLLSGSYWSYGVSVSGPQPFGFTWLKDGQPLEEYGPYLTFNGLDATHSGVYQVMVSNLNGAVTSRGSVLAVEPVNLLGVLLNARQLTFTNSSWNPWFAQTASNLTHDGLACAQSAPVGLFEESAFETAIEGPGSLRFWWKISAASNAAVELLVDGEPMASILGEADWTECSLQMAEGWHTYQWRFHKEDQAEGADAAWVDQLSVFRSAVQLTTGGDAQWYQQTTNTYDGLSAWQSGLIGGSQQSWLRATVEGPGTLSFLWSVSSEAEHDSLSFWLDGGEQVSISGTANWLEQSFHLEPGAHTIEWLYSKDAEGSVDADAGWVDQIAYIPDPVTGDAPEIVAQPGNQTVLANNPVSFSVTVAGDPPLSFQWFKDGELLWGGTTSTYSIENAGSWAAGLYTVMVSNSFGSVTSSNAELVVLEPPSVYAISPGSARVPVGGLAEFIASFAGTLPLQFQWQRDGIDIPGATNSTLVLSNLTSADAGVYSLALTNAYGGTAGGYAMLTVLSLPTILAGPENATRVVGSNVTFSVLADGAPPLVYQWKKNGMDIAGATGSDYAISSITPEDAGVYSVMVTNTYGSAGGLATLVVAVPPYIVTQPVGTALFQNSPLSLQVAAGGTGTLNYRWHREGVALPNATSPVFYRQNASTNDAGHYAVVVTSTYGSVTSAPVMVTVTALPQDYAPTALDTNFPTSLGANKAVRVIETLPDGRYYIGGFFTTVQGWPCQGIARFNADGTVDKTFRSPGFDGTVTAIAVQPNGDVIVGGGCVGAGSGAGCSFINRVHSDGSLDANFIAVPDGYVWSLALQPNGRILVGGQFDNINGVNRSRLARLDTNGAVDLTFNPPPIGGVEAATVSAIVVQPDGKILYATRELITGSQFAHQSVFRLLGNGARDTSFNAPSTYNIQGTNWGMSSTYALKLQPNGKIIAVPGRVVRLLPGGSVDPTFSIPMPSEGQYGLVYAVDLLIGEEPYDDPALVIGGSFGKINEFERFSLACVSSSGSLLSGYTPGTGSDINESVSAVAVRPDKTTIVGGSFSQLGGVDRQNIGIYDSNRVFSANTYAGKGAYSASGGVTVSAVIPLSDGRILVGGNFTSFNGVPCQRIARLLPDVSLDPSFDVGLGANSNITSLALQPDGQLVVGGKFTQFNGQGRSGLARLNADGSLDPAFNPTLTGDKTVYAVALQTDGRILIGGDFDAVNNVSRANLARLNADGSLDETFAVGNGASYVVYDIVVRPDGSVVVAGSFQEINGISAPGLAFLNTTGSRVSIAGYPPVSSKKLALMPDGSVVVGTGYGGGSSRTLWRVTPSGSISSFQYYRAVIGLLAQQDGKVIVYGDTQCLQRFNSDGTEDPTFPSTQVYAVATMKVQTDGHLLLGGGEMTWPAQNGNLPFMFHGIARLEGEFGLYNYMRPSLLPPIATPEGPFVARLKGLAGWSYLLEGSDDLKNWAPLLRTNLPPTGSLDFADPESNSHPLRFYRLRVQ